MIQENDDLEQTGVSFDLQFQARQGASIKS